jgi:hypothetical protein
MRCARPLGQASAPGPSRLAGRPAPHQTGQTPMDQSWGDRARWGRWSQLAATVSVWAWCVAAVGGVAARDARASELLTPVGWGSTMTSAAISGDELLTPSGWGTPSEIAWERSVCSELLIPADWSGLPLRR